MKTIFFVVLLLIGGIAVGKILTKVNVKKLRRTQMETLVNVESWKRLKSVITSTGSGFGFMKIKT